MTEKLQDEEILMYTGSYTKRSKIGLNVFAFHTGKGTLRHLQEVRENNASFLDIRADSLHLYCVSEMESEAGKSGSVSAYRIAPDTGALTLLNRQPTEGGRPTYVHVDQNGQFLLVANYGGGNVSLYPIEPGGPLGERCDFHKHEGSGPRKDRQEKAHPHCIMPDPANRYVFVPDLGTDRIEVYGLDASNRRLVPAGSVSTHPGAGPRHFVFHPEKPFAYVINELDATVTVFTYDEAGGRLDPVQTIDSLPDDFRGENTAADIHLTPDGRFLYVSNRGHDSLCEFAVDPSTGRLSRIGDTPSGGKTPRNFAISPDGRYLVAANQNSDNLVVFRLDPQTGQLEQTEKMTGICEVVCIRMMTSPRSGR